MVIRSLKQRADMERSQMKSPKSGQDSALQGNSSSDFYMAAQMKGVHITGDSNDQNPDQNERRMEDRPGTSFEENEMTSSSSSSAQREEATGSGMKPQSSPSSYCGGDEQSLSDIAEASDAGSSSEKGGRTRVPMCGRCRNHGKLTKLRGHKRYCHWRMCKCARCVVLMDKQRIMAQQVALRRAQKQDQENGLVRPVAVVQKNDQFRVPVPEALRLQAPPMSGDQAPLIQPREPLPPLNSSISPVGCPTSLHQPGLAPALPMPLYQSPVDGSLALHHSRLSPSNDVPLHRQVVSPIEAPNFPVLQPVPSFEDFLRTMLLDMQRTMRLEDRNLPLLVYALSISRWNPQTLAEWLHIAQNSVRKLGILDN